MSSGAAVSMIIGIMIIPIIVLVLILHYVFGVEWKKAFIGIGILIAINFLIAKFSEQKQRAVYIEDEEPVYT